jgi:hypothetical protein
MGEKEKCNPFWRSIGLSIEMDIGHCDKASHHFQETYFFLEVYLGKLIFVFSS